MNDHFRNQYFTALRTVLLLMILIYTILSSPLLTGASVWMLLLLALFTGVLSFKELVSRRLRKVFLAVAVYRHLSHLRKRNNSVGRSDRI